MIRILIAVASMGGMTAVITPRSNAESSISTLPSGTTAPTRASRLLTRPEPTGEEEAYGRNDKA